MRRLNRRRTWIIGIILLIVVAQFALFQPVRDVARVIASSPVNALDVTARKVKSFFSLISSITDLSKENADLRQKNNDLTAQLANLQNLKNENEVLRKDLEFSQTRAELNLAPATILNYSPTGTFQAITINKGEKDGIRVEQAVVSNGYLIGKVKNISQSTAEVWLLSNRNLLTPVLLTNSKTSGILKGGIRGLVVDSIPIDAAVTPGEMVVTSALEGLYPAGIAVGLVEEVISTKEEIFVSARISSPINIRNIQTVFVVK